jgi:tetratricopeptide (TPR) repeat protein
MNGIWKVRGSGLVLALGVALLSACAPAATGTGTPGMGGERPRDDADTRAAGVALAQAAMAEGEAAVGYYEQALSAALNAIERDPTNPRAYLLAGQASAGTADWVQADTMFTRAQELSPRLAEQVDSERHEGWVMAYNYGAEALNEGDVELAIQHFHGADRLYQRRPEARLALAHLYVRQADAEGAIAAYEGALEILDGPAPEGTTPEQLAAWAEDRHVAIFNLASLLAETGRHGDAVDLMSQFLAEAGPSLDSATRLRAMTAQAAYLVQAGRDDEAEVLYREIMERPDLDADDYFHIGVGLFNSGDYEAAANAFGRSAELNPYSRDAHLNLVQSYYSSALELEREDRTPERDARLHELYQQVIEGSDRVFEFDPYNRNLLSFVLRAYQGKAAISSPEEVQRLTQRVQALVREFEAQPYEVSNIQFTPAPNEQVRIAGTLTNLGTSPGATVTLRFEILDENGNVADGSSTQVTVPGEDERVQFSLLVNMEGYQMAGWRYNIVR